MTSLETSGTSLYSRIPRNGPSAARRTAAFTSAPSGFFRSRQGVGIYKCCNIVYSPPTRGYNFDVEFLTPSLLPPRTPMFRDVNTLTFRQVLRPTQ